MRSKGIYLGGNVVVESGNVFPLTARYDVGDTLEVEYTTDKGITFHKRIKTDPTIAKAFEKLLDAEVAILLDIAEYLKLSFLGYKFKVLHYTTKGIIVESSDSIPGSLDHPPIY